MTVDWVRRSSPPDSSSAAKTTPAIGVLNAAATPAAPPATITARRPGRRRPRISVRMIPATTCTVGPSRPIEPPHSSRNADSTTFHSAVASDTRRPPRRWCQRVSAAAITCGMPLPAAAGANRRVAQAAMTKPIGSNASTASGWRVAAAAWTAIAASHSLAKPAAAAPPITATTTTVTA